MSAKLKCPQCGWTGTETREHVFHHGCPDCYNETTEQETMLIKDDMNLKTLNTALLNNGGFSYSLTLGDVSGTQNYSVAFNKASENVFDSLPTDAEYREYITKYINELSREDMVLGAWEHEGKYYLDMAQLLDKRSYSKEAAISTGKHRNQIAIFDLEYMEEISCN